VKNIFAIIVSLFLVSSVVFADKYNYECVGSAIHNFEKNITIELTPEQSAKGGIAVFQYDSNKELIVDIDGETFKYFQTIDGVKTFVSNQKNILFIPVSYIGKPYQRVYLSLDVNSDITIEFVCKVK